MDLESVFGRRARDPYLIDAVDGRRWTYAEFRETAAQLAGWLTGIQGLAPGSRVGLLLESSCELATLYFACLAAEVVAVPMNPALRLKDIDFAVRTSGIKLMLYSTRTAPIAAALPESVPWIRVAIGREDGGASFLDDLPPAEPVQFRCGHAPFSTTFTSGTTGQPKSVTHSSANLFGNACAFNESTGLTADARFLHVMPMTYMAGFLNTLLVPFAAGASVVVDRPFDARSSFSFWKPVMRFEVTTMWLAPTMLSALLKLDRDTAGKEYAREHLEGIWVGTAPLPRHVQDAFEERYAVRLFESYGLSELLIVSSNGPRDAVKEGSVGVVLDGVRVRINPERDEIEVNTPFVCDEWRGAGASEGDLWSATGDQGSIDEDGHVHITGRLKDLIIRGGINVSPRQIEEVLHSHPMVERAAVVGVPHDFYGEDIVAFVQLRDTECDPGALTAELSAACRADLSSSALPSRFLLIDEMPSSSTGKVDKVELRRRAIT